MSDSPWRAFELRDLIEKQQDSWAPYHEFLRIPSMSCGVYSLRAGASDLQGPHDEDEVYFVVSGRGRVRVAGEERAIGPGSILWVEATSEHSFFEIDEDITMLVFFGSGGPSRD